MGQRNTIRKSTQLPCVGYTCISYNMPKRYVAGGFTHTRPEGA